MCRDVVLVSKVVSKRPCLVSIRPCQRYHGEVPSTFWAERILNDEKSLNEEGHVHACTRHGGVVGLALEWKNKIPRFQRLSQSAEGCLWWATARAKNESKCHQGALLRLAKQLKVAQRFVAVSPILRFRAQKRCKGEKQEQKMFMMKLCSVGPRTCQCMCLTYIDLNHCDASMCADPDANGRIILHDTYLHGHHTTLMLYMCVCVCVYIYIYIYI